MNGIKLIVLFCFIKLNGDYSIDYEYINVIKDIIEEILIVVKLEIINVRMFC